MALSRFPLVTVTSAGLLPIRLAFPFAPFIPFFFMALAGAAEPSPTVLGRERVFCVPPHRALLTSSFQMRNVNKQRAFQLGSGHCESELRGQGKRWASVKTEKDQRSDS